MSVTSPEYQRMAEAAKAAKDAERLYGVRDGERDKLFPDPERAVQWAVRSCRRTGCGVTLYEFNGHGRSLGQLATVDPAGRVDLTWRGAELVSCRPPQAKRVRSVSGEAT